MIDYHKNSYKIIKKDDFFKIIEINPNAVFVKNTVELKNEKISVCFYLTKVKLLKRFGTSCSCCGVNGRYFILYKNGDIKLIGIKDYNLGQELEITLHNRKPFCSTCIALKTSRLNRKS